MPDELQKRAPDRYIQQSGGLPLPTYRLDAECSRLTFSFRRAGAIVGAALALYAGAAYATKLHNDAAVAVSQFHVAQHAADSTARLSAQVLRADSALVRRASVDSTRAAHFAAEASRLETRLHLVAVPDTCKPIVILADSALAAKDSALAASSARGDSLSKGLDSTQAALRSVLASQRQLGASASIVAHAAKPSLLSRIVPHPGIGLAAGVDANGQPHLITGITFGWTF